MVVAYDRPRLHRHHHGLFPYRRALCPRLRNPLTICPMETILTGLIALALLAYLTVAMLRPEKF
jgi:K+-transporting ATPase KdpF subunit